MPTADAVKRFEGTGAGGVAGRPSSTGLHRSVPAAPRGCDRGGASQRVEAVVLWSSPHSGNGREKGDASEVTPRRYICAVSRTKLSRKRGSGGRATKSTTWCSPEPPPAIFLPLLDRSKRGSPPERRNPPKSKGTAQNRRGGASPSPTARPRGQILRAGLGPAPTAGQMTIHPLNRHG